MKTKAAVLREVNQPLVIEELEVPRLQKGQVLIEVIYSGLCRSQISEINGWKGREFIPHLMGHEASALVLEVGEGVAKVKPDDRVVASWIKGEGLEASSVVYQSDQGGVNAGAVATFCQYSVVSENRLVAIDNSIEPDIAALLGCAIPTGAGIIDNILRIEPGRNLIVFGIGGIGASALLRAVSLGIDCAAVDIMDWKLEWAKKVLGVSKAFYPVELLSLKEDFDFAIECTGSQLAMQQAFVCLKPKGVLVIAGNLKPGQTIAIDPFELIKGKRLLGTWGGECNLDWHIPHYLKDYSGGGFPFGKLVTRTYNFGEINQGLEDLAHSRLIRGVVKISSFV